MPNSVILFEFPLKNPAIYIYRLFSSFSPSFFNLQTYFCKKI